MATTSGYDYGIRQGLVNKGVSSADIGYNPGTGYVTVKGQNAIKAPKVYNGTSFTNQQAFNTDWDAYNKGLQATQQQPAQTGYQPTGGAGATTGTAPQQGVVYQQPTYTQPQAAPTIDQRIADLYTYAQNQPTFDPYSTSAYAAAQAQADRAAQQGIRGAQEAFGSAGFGRSTALGERAQRIGQEGTEYLMTQVLPQIQAQEEARRQQQFQNMFSLLTPQQQQQQFAEQTAQGRAGLTGSFISPEAQQTINQLMGLKQQAEAQGITREGRAGLSSQADVLRNQLLGMGVDPSLFGAGVTSAQATQNIGRAGKPTLEAGRQAYDIETGERDYARGVLESERAYEYTAGRDKEADERWQAEFDYKVQKDGLNSALDWAKQTLNEQKEGRISAGKTSGGSKSISSKPTAEDEEFDPNMPLTMSDMYKYIEGKLPSAMATYGPSNKNDLIERMILSNPNLSDKDVFKLYQKFGLKVPE